MCDSGQFVFNKRHRCSICGKSPAAKTDDYSDDYNYCENCALETFGEETFNFSFELNEVEVDKLPEVQAPGRAPART